jgi:hypothetical protein
MFFPYFVLGVMDKFIIMNVHDATPENPQKQSMFFPIFLLLYEKNPC